MSREVKNNYYDVMVVGGGHAGIEALNLSNKLNLKAILITKSIRDIAKISCNPSIGGVGKSQVIKEVDILGGLMAKVAEYSSLDRQILNKYKGLAVQSSRLQVDKGLYEALIGFYLYKYNYLIIEGIVKELLILRDKVIGIKLIDGSKLYSKIVILATGSFNYRKKIVGLNDYDKDYCGSTYCLSKQLLNVFKDSYLFKTGTPPRMVVNTVKALVDNKRFKFIKNKLSLNNKVIVRPLIKGLRIKGSNKINYLVKKYTKYSARYSGMIKGIGPRYCPSLEDKVNNFINIKHNYVLERESILNTIIYPSGLSTSLPGTIQRILINNINDLYDYKLISKGYSVEYFYINPNNLKNNMETKLISNLFIVGQLCGTTGYEESAALGVIVAIYSYLKLLKKKNRYITNDNSYIKTIVNDLNTLNIREPYRLFTHRNVNRLFIREDNAFIRFNKVCFVLRLYSIARYRLIYIINGLINKLIINEEDVNCSVNYSIKLLSDRWRLVKNNALMFKNNIVSKLRYFNLKGSNDINIDINHNTLLLINNLSNESRDIIKKYFNDIRYGIRTLSSYGRRQLYSFYSNC